MARDDPFGSLPDQALYCDLTQSWSAHGGGVGTYIRHKRQYILDHSDYRHLMIVPGAADRTTVEEGGRAITVTIKSPRVPGSPNYRLLLRNRAVRDALAAHRPALIECQDAYNLPWAALAHRRKHPETALIAAYCTDFPTVYVERTIARFAGQSIGAAAGRAAYRYAANLYCRFDAVFAMSENGGAAKLRSLGVVPVNVVPLGVELGQFSPAKRSPALRASLGLADDEPLIIYAGRLDSEKRAETVVEAFLRLPGSMRAMLVLLGEGPTRAVIAERLTGKRAWLPGYVRDRSDLARWLASADFYASGMANETFGISVIEAQASGLPVVGVAAGAMVDRVTPEIGRVGPVDDAQAMADHLVQLWSGDHRAMKQAACRHAQQFSWQQSMQALFGELYPRAITAALRRSGAATVRGNSIGARTFVH